LLTGCGHECVVVAPSLIPMKAGDRVKTDRRDALMLAKLHRAGELTAIWIPDAAHEAMRDLVRARATAVRVLAKARQHLQGVLLRHQQIYYGARAWTLAYRRWLTTVRFEHPAQQIVLQVLHSCSPRS
jgi:transposase